MSNTTSNYEDHINKMYDSNLQSQKTQLETAYQQSIADLDKEKAETQRQTDTALTRTYVEAAKAQKAQQEYDNVYGLTSGAMAQARLAQDNQLQADLTTIRAAQQEADAEVERQRSLLAKEYTAAITQAQADNDMERAQALYEAAKQADADLLAKQKEAASLMAGAGDFSLYQVLYGLTDEQVRALGRTYNAQNYTDDTGTDDDTDAADDESTPVENLQNGIIKAASALNPGNWLQAGLNYLFGKKQETYDTSYEGIKAQYAALKQGGATQRELDSFLKAAEGKYITDRQATEIRDGRY